MLFHSPEFILLFLPLAVIGYHAVRQFGGMRAALGLLVLASLVFYGWWDPRFIGLLLGSAAVNFILGRYLSARHRQGKPSRSILIFGITINLGLLGYFKYADFFIGNINLAAGLDVTTLQIALPLAISFFTFQQIAFLVDAHSGAAEDPDLLSYLLFVTFFPQLIAGPIVHHKEMMPQFAQTTRDTRIWDDLAVGFTIFTIGLFKKTVIADRMGFWSDRVFESAALGAPVPLMEAWSGALAFTFQIYFDFSGYTDMAIGLALMFGIRLPINFASPYKATSIIDFWRRWHITLSRFLRDYLYIPLGGNRNGRSRRYTNLLIVMLLGGLWHGAAWTFVLWGALHGFYLVVNHLWRRVTDIRTAPSLAARWAGRCVTLLAVIVAWVVFRADSLDTAQSIYAGMIGLNGLVLPTHYFNALGSAGPMLESFGVVFGQTPLFGGGFQLLWYGIVLAAVWFLPNSQSLLHKFRPVLSDTISETSGRLKILTNMWRPNLITGVVTGVAAAILVLRQLQGTPGEFIYFQF